MRLRTLAAMAVATAALACAALLVGCAAPQDAAAPSPEGEEPGASAEVAAEADALRIGSLKGPTSVGLASMMEKGQGAFTVAASADEIAPALLQGKLDIALVPANLAATLYQKTEGQVRALDVNTLGVLYAVSAADVAGVEGLAGRTVYMTGKGTVPEYTMRALLEAADVSDSVDLQFRSEPTEVAALIAQDHEAVGILPQPYAASAVMGADELGQRIDLTQAWEEATQGTRGSLVTGVTIALADTVEAKQDAIREFLRRHEASALVAQVDPEAIAQEVVDLGIIADLKVAEAAIPRCNVVCLTGSTMREALSQYLAMLEEQDPASIGGSLPGSEFYFEP